jgi:ActR/RegA family two-component response regulator
VRSPAGRIGALYDDASTRTAVAATMERCGFAVVVLDGPAPDLVAQAHALAPDVLVLDLAGGGVRGLRLVRELRRALPRCAIVLLTPFETLRDAAVEAGAYELVGRDDLRDLQRCLLRLGADLDARGSAVLRRPYVRST